MAAFDVERFVSSDIVSRHPQIVNDLESRILNYIQLLIADGRRFDRSNPLVIADIGCGDGQFTKQLVQKLPKQIHTVVPYLIDPYGNHNVGIHTFGEDVFSNQFPSAHCDVIICKGSAHLFSDFYRFLTNCQRILKQGGMFIMVQMSDEIKFPWGQYAQKSFDVSTKAESFEWVRCDELRPNNAGKLSANLIKHCVVHHMRFNRKVTVSKEQWINFIMSRAWSTLQSLTENQIEDCILFVKNKYKQSDDIQLNIRWIVTECIKKQFTTQCKL
eukprot:219773_1